MVISYVTSFQFQYGAIERVVYLFAILRLSLFQFQYGAIESLGSVFNQPASSKYFNSSMVRLKEPVQNHSYNRFKFQFQYGAIERSNYSKVNQRL